MSVRQKHSYRDESIWRSGVSVCFTKRNIHQLWVNWWICKETFFQQCKRLNDVIMLIDDNWYSSKVASVHSLQRRVSDFIQKYFRSLSNVNEVIICLNCPSTTSCHDGKGDLSLMCFPNLKYKFYKNFCQTWRTLANIFLSFELQPTYKYVFP